MRKSREEAAETRKSIVRAAAREFREKGIVATGLADLMKAAGLTHGGFYKHFVSKDQLVAEATAAAMDGILEELATRPTVNSAVAGYLSTRHRDNPASGCPLAALGGELARSDKETRAAATAGFTRLVDILAGNARAADVRRQALVAAVTMIGAVTMSRVVSDPKLSDEILDAARETLVADTS
ncbi:MAG TPA: TetR family transcriptional regulator [Acetobacteraceae bacterium]|nr:TetR family transcriptional regulator [Acetobacteraceae bacterium]